MLYEFGLHNIELPGKAPKIDAASRVVLWHDGQVVMNAEDISWPYSEVEDKATSIEFVCLLNNKAYFSAHTNSSVSKLLSLRDIAFLGETQFMICARAKAHHDWRSEHKYCGKCGQPSTQVANEFALQCAPCRLRFYPRIAPCIIVLVTQGEQVLLAQGVKHREQGWYGCIAGFIESGESAEQAVAREVKEEVNIEVDRIEYQNSQAWPFPNQLMLGYTAEYAGGVLTPAAGEIADAQWFDINELPKHPPSISIAGWLIRQYKQKLEQL